MITSQRVPGSCDHVSHDLKLKSPLYKLLGVSHKRQVNLAQISPRLPSEVIFKLRDGASRGRFVGRSVGRSVCRSVCGKF